MIYMTSSCHQSCRTVFATLFFVAALSVSFGTASKAQNPQPTLAERIKAKAAALEILRELDPRSLNQEQLTKISSALLLGVQYGAQAKADEAKGYVWAHQKAAYDWGYQVGDPTIVKMVRLYWEGVQLGVFGVGDLQQLTGEKSPRWSTLEAMVGGNGQEYDVDAAYIDDIFNDVQIAVDGAERALQGGQNDFEQYAEQRLEGND